MSKEDVILNEILEDLKKERCYSCDKWGNDFDDANTLNDWVAYICMYAGDSAKMKTPAEDSYIFLKKVANLAISAMHAYKRNGKWSDRHYEVV